LPGFLANAPMKFRPKGGAGKHHRTPAMLLDQAAKLRKKRSSLASATAREEDSDTFCSFMGVIGWGFYRGKVQACGARIPHPNPIRLII
jgi:hypothetical protein